MSNMNKRLTSTIPGIYLITNNANGKAYVGQARKISIRWSIHRHHLRHGTHNNHYLQRAWDKLGEASFVFSIEVDLSHIPEDRLAEELNFHEALVFSEREETYNILEPGFQGPICGPETRAKLSAISLAKWDRIKANPELIASMHAWRYTTQGQETMSQAAIKRWENPATRAAVTMALRARANNPEYMKTLSGNAVSQWADPAKREAMSAGLKAAWADPEVRASRLDAIRIGQEKAKLDPNSPMHTRAAKRWANPELKDQQSDRMKSSWTDPGIREKRCAAMRAAHARRRALLLTNP